AIEREGDARLLYPATDVTGHRHGEVAVDVGWETGVVGVEARLGGAQIIQRAGNELQAIGYVRQEAFVRMEVMALIPVEAGEAKEAGKDEDQQQRHHSQRFGSRERPARRRLGCYLFCG